MGVNEIKMYVDYKHVDGNFGFYKLFYNDTAVEFDCTFEEFKVLLEKHYDKNSLTIMMVRVGWSYHLSLMLKDWGYNVEGLCFHNERSLKESKVVDGCNHEV